MNESIEIIKSIYKPYRYTYKGKALIIETSSGNYVIKEKENNLEELFSYLKSRSFNNYPNLIDYSRKDINIFEYIEDTNNPKEQKVMDMIDIVADLHNKTSYYKDVTEDNYKKIYDDILNNINYLEDYYSSLYDLYYHEIYMSPSIYLFMRNYSKIKSNLLFCHKELDNWFDLVKDNNKTRVSMVHNNLAIDHFIKNNKNYLISWDKAIIDSPILDLINLYHNNYYEVNFTPVFNEYMKRFNLSIDEKKLLFVMISIPFKIEFNDNELNNCKNVSNILEYIYKTEELIRPYYSEEKEE